MGGVFPFPTFPEEPLHISLGSFRSLCKIKLVFKLEVLVVLAEVARCYLWGLTVQFYCFEKVLERNLPKWELLSQKAIKSFGRLLPK